MTDGLSFLVIEVLTPDQLEAVSGGEYLAIVGARPDLSRNGLPADNKECDPSQPGDVLSVQPDGTLQTRPAGTAGPFELCCKTTAGLVYRPVGAGGRSFLIPLAQDAPN